MPVLVLGWLAYFFGRTLRAGKEPLIERIARIGKPDLSPALCRYTRVLTAVWTVYFVIAAALKLLGTLAFAQASLGVACVSALLFVGEYWLRTSVLFRHETFPSLAQQVRDTVSSWRPSR